MVPYKIKNNSGDIYTFAGYENGLPLYRCAGGLTHITELDIKRHIVLEQAAPKEDCKLIGEDGNIFNLMALVSRAMRKNPYWTYRVDEMIERVKSSQDYYKALVVLGEYVNIK